MQLKYNILRHYLLKNLLSNQNLTSNKFYMNDIYNAMKDIR